MHTQERANVLLRTSDARRTQTSSVTSGDGRETALRNRLRLAYSTILHSSSLYSTISYENTILHYTPLFTCILQLHCPVVFSSCILDLYTPVTPVYTRLQVRNAISIECMMFTFRCIYSNKTAIWCGRRIDIDVIFIFIFIYMCACSQASLCRLRCFIGVALDAWLLRPRSPSSSEPPGTALDDVSKVAQKPQTILALLALHAQSD